MALDFLNMIEVGEALENYLAKERPPVEMRNDLDIGYKIDNQPVN